MTPILALLVLSTVSSAPQYVRWKDPFEVLPTPSVVGPLEQKLEGKTSAVWQDGRVLTFLHKSSAASLHLGGGIQKPMSRVPGSDLWILRLRMEEGWDKAFVTYMFVSPGTPQVNVRPSLWRGSQAPPRPERVAKPEELKGKIIQRTIKSPNLGEERAVSVYLPPNAPKSGLPAFFMTDGGACSAFAQILEPLILAGKIRPVAIIGAYSGTYKGAAGAYDNKLDYRTQEYIPGYSRFSKHVDFFFDELTKWATAEYGISSRREDRALFGFSNGGSFTAGSVVRRPEVFGAAIPMSVGMLPVDKQPSSPLPRMFFFAGTLESFSEPTKKVSEQMKSWGADTKLTLYTAGHDFEMWLLGFAEFAPQVFPPKG